MSVFKEIKQDFIYDLAGSGNNTWDFGEYSELKDKVIPEKTLDKWVSNFYKNQECVWTDKPRVVNHFKLGADPEFVFMENANVVHANALGLKAGLCFGADNNGRLAELRPKASKSALRVVASMYAELCFLAQWNPGLIRYTWYASPFAGKDGLGGHVHFGRWSDKARQRHEVNALNNVMIALTNAGLISGKLQKNRLATNLYGKFGDIRAQMHGYEYRTFPSWLGCPRQAHLYLTLSKLAVHMPQLFMRVAGLGTVQYYRNFIYNILSFFQNLDDDARIAKGYFAHCVTPPDGDIQKTWNIQPIFSLTNKRKDEILPPTITPDEVHVKYIFDYLTKGVFSPGQPKKFEPLKFPEGFSPFQHVTNTDRQPDLGELIWDLALVPVGHPLEFVASHLKGTDKLQLSPILYDMVVNKLKKKFIQLPSGEQLNFLRAEISRNIGISFPSFILKREYSTWFKKYLTESGVFPFVRLGQEVKPIDWKVKTQEKLLLMA